MPSIDYRAPPTVAAFMRSNAFIRALMGPFGSGKSVGCTMELLRMAQAQQPNENGVRKTRFAVIRNTARMLRDTTVKTVHEWVPPGVAGTWHSTTATFFIRFGDVESEWLFRALDDADDVRNLLSLELTNAWVNEYREIRPEIFLNLLGRVGRFPRISEAPPTNPGVIMDSNPPPFDSYWYDFFETEPPDEVREILKRISQDRPLAALYKQPSGLAHNAENTENLPENYYDLLVASQQGKNPDWIDVHVHGRYGTLPEGEPVYRAEYDPRMHNAADTLAHDPRRPLALGLDFGLTPACVIAQQNAKGQWVLLSEMVTPKGTTMGIERFLDFFVLPLLRRRFGDVLDFEVVGDPAGSHRTETNEKTCFDVLRSRGFRTVRKGPSDLETRIGSVKRVMARLVDGQPGLLIDPDCRTFRQGCAGGYYFREKRNTGTVDPMLAPEPVKNHFSHIHDAVQHLLGYFEGPAMKGRAPRAFRVRSHGEGPIKLQKKWNVYAR